MSDDNGFQSDQSFAQHLLEQLSENISQLIHLVVFLQEQNAELPVDQISDVANAAAAIADISISLANDEYSDYPDIKNEILAASSKMAITKKHALDSINSFSRQTNRKKAWENLSDNCRSIGNETIKILHVVYGAELKRLIIHSDRAKTAVESIRIERLADDAQTFADGISNSVSEIFKFASYLKLRANDEDAPWVKGEYISQADQLVETGNKLITITNDLLAYEGDGIDPAHQNNFKQTLASLAQNINSSTQRVKEMAQQNHMNLISTVAASPSQTSNNNNGTQRHSATHERDLMLEELVRATSKSVTELLRAAYKGDASSVSVVAKSLENITDILINKVKTIRQPSSEFNAMCTKLKATVSRYTALAVQVVDSPGNAQLIAQMGEPVEEIQDILQTLLGQVSTRDAQLINIIQSKQDCLTILNETEEPAVIVSTLKHLSKNHKKMESMITRSDPIEVSAAIQQLSSLLPQQIQVAKQFLRDPTSDDTRKQLQNINTEMKTPLAHLVALMEPTSRNEAHEAALKERTSSAKIIDAALKGNAREVDDMINELEQIVSSLVALATAEATYDSAIGQALGELTDQLIKQLASRRAIVAKLVANPRSEQLQHELDKINNTISMLTVAVSESVSSDLGVLLHKLKVAASEGQLTKVDAFIREITNKANIPVHTVNTQESIKSDPTKARLFSSLASDLLDFVGLLTRECKATQANQRNDTTRLEYLGQEVQSRYNDLQKHLLQSQEQQQPHSSGKGREPQEGTSLPDEEPTEKKILQLFSELLDHIRRNEAVKSVSTLKAMIGEQDKLTQKASDLMSRTFSAHFRAQIESSITLFKSTISLAINTAGKLAKSTTPNAGDETLNKCIRTVKKSIVELGHLLKFNAHIEVIAAYTFLTGQSGSTPDVQRALYHFKEFARQLNRSPKIGELVERINATMLSPKSLDSMFEIFLYCNSFVQESAAHQINAKYHILTSFESDKDMLISESVNNIVYHQTDLLRQATDYLSTLNPARLEDTTKRILYASLQTAQQSLAQQVESAISLLDKKPRDVSSLDKLVTVIDVIRESVENAASAAFNAHQQQVDQDTLISQSIGGFIPTISLSTSKHLSNPSNNESKKKLDNVVEQITIPLEQLELSRTSKRPVDAAEEKIPPLVQEEEALINRLLAYVIDSDKQGIVDVSKALVKCHQELVGQAEALARDDVKEAVKDTVQDLVQLVPQQLSAIKQALQVTDNDPIDSQIHQRPNHIANQIKRNINNLQELLVPSFSSKKLANRLKSQTSSPLQQGEALKQQVVQLRATVQSIVDDANQELGYTLDPERQQRIRDAIRDLENRLKGKSNPQSLDVSTTVLLSSPNDFPSITQYDHAKQNVMESTNGLISELSGTSQQLLAQLQQSINLLTIGSVRGNFNQLRDLTKSILVGRSALKAQLEKDLVAIQSAEKKAIIAHAQGELDALLPLLIRESKNYILNSTDHKKREELEMLQTRLKAPIASILYELNNTQGNMFHQLVANHQSTLISLGEAVRTGKRAECTPHLKALEEMHAKLVVMLEKDQVAPTKAILKEQMAEVDRISSVYTKAVENNTVSQTLEVDKDLLSFNLMLTVANMVPNKSVVSSKRATGGTDADPNDHINNILRSLKSNNVLNLSKNPDKVVKYVSIQSGGEPSHLASKASTQTTSTSKAKGKQPLQLDAPKSSSSTPQNLEDSLINTAKQIGADMEQMKKIAVELENYAKCIKANERQKMIQSGRAIATLLNELSTDITKIAKDCKVAHLQTKMYQGTQTLKTLGCQIKILSGVKAVSPVDSPNPDSDNQLASLVALLGTTLKDINTCINTHSLTTAGSGNKSRSFIKS
ncbi:hypothetical protein SAMD00019534_080990 [Acytostelium subglobosum LB1]|uniref:hypothetical protein n=1 Tax=Acytostelium subglobosum LB1 TaxID=1410327 RepID=UPI000644A438|nr:hypothetical protein SAMD00019534_080990 [Acytostelium subglobosum LB1]GAM24924.1 hypothetical protein SAMD00019534_080990 [Acytostelium subglobosum LB1]|eukprot:XP_012752013.1 hypothetical protein SAMD00019534_080990 [Acytostelium subglobosum LB1]